MGRIDDSKPSSVPANVTNTRRTEVIEAESHLATEDNTHIAPNGHVAVCVNGLSQARQSISIVLEVQMVRMPLC